MRRKSVKLPADYLTAGQKKGLNGMAVTYTMDKPHTYLELLAFPKDIRKEYLEGLKQKYHPSIADMMKMLHVKREVFYDLIKSLGIEWPREYRTNKEKREWLYFIGEDMAEREEKAKAESQPKEEKPFSIPFPLPMAFPRVDHVALHIIGKPMAVSNSIVCMLDPTKEYYFSINVTEHNHKEAEVNESCSCGAGETCDLEGTA